MHFEHAFVLLFLTQNIFIHFIFIVHFSFIVVYNYEVESGNTYD